MKLSQFYFVRSLLIVFGLTSLVLFSFGSTSEISASQETYLLEKISQHLKALGYQSSQIEGSLSEQNSEVKVHLSKNETLNFRWDSDLSIEAFEISKRDGEISISGGNISGLLYGFQEFGRQLKTGKGFGEIETIGLAPHHEFRAVKFNLPWSSYRVGESIQQHLETVKDLSFWEGFMDMMVENRFNALTLWNLHPFTFMIQPNKYPEAIQFTGQEFKDWQHFWRSLFQMAKDRGIETYIINWNIFTSPQFTEAHDVANYKDELEWHYGFTPPETSEIVVDYTRECVTQVINEYPNLTGLGVSIGERMKMPLDDSLKWIHDTFIQGMRNADRRVKFIHRAPFKNDPVAARKIIETYTDFPDPIIMEFKFNWSHSHSTPHLEITHGGKVADQFWNPKPSNYKMAWMMRNEDFFMLNWGEPDFIREHMRVNDGDHVTGYFIGSETYIPAKEFRMKEGVNYNWQYAYEKQWQFYSMWGHLLYNPQTEDQFFVDLFQERYREIDSRRMFRALKLGSRMPLRLASFYRSTWDMTLYSEGFLNGKQLYRNYKEPQKAFINIEEMIAHPTLDPNYMTVEAFVDKKTNGIQIDSTRMTPDKLAAQLEQDAHEVLEILNSINPPQTTTSPNLEIELNDIRTWAHMSLYFSEKLKGAILLQEARIERRQSKQAQAIEHLQLALGHWKTLAEITDSQYRDVSLLHLRTYKFSWKFFLPQVAKDIEYAKGLLIEIDDKHVANTGKFNGFELHEFQLDDFECKVAIPTIPAQGRPWIWRARFWGKQFREADIALLREGFHIVYADVAGLFGSDKAIARWDKFYPFVTRTYDLDSKAVLEGLSRGGLIVYNWGSRNTDKIHCIYADAPVCDFKSWPAGKGKGEENLRNWKTCLDAYGMTETEALAWKGNPIDRLQPLANAGIPLLHVVGDTDKIVPVEENTAIIERRYKKLGGQIEVIHKPGVGHHPHCLEDPTPIVEFISRTLKHSKG